MSYCPDHDPILWATSLTCRRCGAESWPTDAEWVSETLLLATFTGWHEPGCPTPNGFSGAVLLDLGQDDTGIPRLPGPRLCRGTATTTGRQCRARPRPGSGYCHQHDPQRRGAAP